MLFTQFLVPTVPVGRSIAKRCTGESAVDDELRFQRFYHDAFGFVHRKARRMLASPDEANDVAQEAFTRAWTRWPQVRACRSPLGWALVATTNICLDRLRHRKIVEAHRTQDVPIVNGTTDVTDELTLRRILALLRGEPRLTQLVVAHCLIDGMTQDEAALVLNIARKTVQRHLERFRLLASRSLERTA